MAYEFTRLADVEAVSDAQDGANVLVEENGEIKRVPKSQVGGAGFVVNATCESFSFGGEENGFATDKTYEEVFEAVAAGKNVSMVLHFTDPIAMTMFLPLSAHFEADALFCFGGAVAFEVPGSNPFVTAYMKQDGVNKAWAMSIF